MIIDAQVHAYEANTPQRPWLKQAPTWPAHVTGNEMVAAMDKVGVDGAIFVSTSNLYGSDLSHLTEVQRAYPGRFALAWAPDLVDDPAIEDRIAAWKQTPGAVAMRVRMAAYGDNDPQSPVIPRILRAAARHGLIINLQCGGNLHIAADLIDRHPETSFVIDHLGIYQPRSRPVPPDVWAELPKVLELARRPNTAIKITGACTMSREPFPYPDIWDPLGRMFDAWGMDRCLWGTDWTRTYSLVNYEQAIEAFRLTDRLSNSDRAKLMGSNSARIYGWSPKK